MTSGIIKVLAVVGVLSMAACGGGSSAPDRVSDRSDQRMNEVKGTSYNSLLDDFGAFSRRYGSIDFTAEKNIPITGVATYRGVGAYRPSSTPENAQDPILGKAVLVADFGKHTISGDVSNFKAAPGNQTTGGNMKLNGKIQGNRILGNISGDINLNGQQHRFSNKVFGGFRGENASAVGGGSFGKNQRGEDYIASIAGIKAK